MYRLLGVRNFSGRGKASAADMLDPRVIDASGELVERTNMTEEQISDVVKTMHALRAWHSAAERMSSASQRHMQLNSTDMRAIRYLMSMSDAGGFVTPGMLAEHLEVSTAATTKMLDRMERGGHVARSPHPTDRRAIVVRVTDETRHDARETVGRQHARRFAVAAAMTAEERAIVRRFLEELAATELE